MRTPFHGTYQDDLTREVIVVNFAGGGGSCVGIEQALGRPVDYAINHDPAAIAMHAVNHPLTTHFQEDVFAVDYARKGGRADTMEELHRVFSGHCPRDRRPTRVAV